MIRVSAPGKTILMGEHAAVYGRPALVAAIDRRLTVTLEPGRTPGQVELDLPRIGVRETAAWDAIRAYARDRAEAWRAYAEQPSPRRFAAVRGTDPAHLVKVALGEAALFRAGVEPPACVLRLSSEIPLGAGFGSSAAVAAAVVFAYLCLVGDAPDPASLDDLVLEVERRQHGLPSGVDGATVLRGALVWARKTDHGVEVEEVAPRAAFFEHVRVYNTGTPADATGDVVAAVRRRVDADPERYERILADMERRTRELRSLLGDPSTPAASFVAPIRRFEGSLERLGVVPERVRESIRAIEAAGGAAKISGAGSLRGDGAGSLLVYHPERGEHARPPGLAAYTALDLRLGAPGVRLEHD